jgi:hypothetical protein
MTVAAVRLTPADWSTRRKPQYKTAGYWLELQGRENNRTFQRSTMRNALQGCCHAYAGIFLDEEFARYLDELRRWRIDGWRLHDASSG